MSQPGFLTPRPSTLAQCGGYSMILAIGPRLLIPPKDHSQLPIISSECSPIRYLGMRPVAAATALSSSMSCPQAQTPVFETGSLIYLSLILYNILFFFNLILKSFFRFCILFFHVFLFL